MVLKKLKMLDLGETRMWQKEAFRLRRGSCASFEPEGWLVEVTVLVKVEVET
jgi:hypothetical protein